jgi:hypothetical protein
MNDAADSEPELGSRGNQPDGFRLKYIAERLRELSAERDRLVEERRAIQARRRGGTESD